MEGLPSLATLPSIMPSPSPATNSSGDSVASKIISSVASNLVFGGIPVQRAVIILLGFLLIAAGIFAFRPVRETVISTAKAGATAAAV